MKYIVYIIAAFISLASCKREPDNTGLTDNEKPLDTTRVSYLTPYKDSIIIYRARRDVIKSKIEDLDKKIALAAKNNEMDKAINNLETGLDKLNDKLEALKNSTTGTWKEQKMDVDNSLKKLEFMTGSTIKVYNSNNIRP
jgi:chromosome segregation ATPase